MFREMLRKKQELSVSDCIAILKKEPRGVLSVLGDDDYPYGMPLNHYYCEEDGKLYFHGGKSGHKIDSLRKHNKVSYCVYDEGFRKEGEWALNIKSVIIFGKVEFIEDQEEINRISRLLSYKFTDDEEYIQKEIERSGNNTLMFAIEIEHMTGKIVKEA
ncbi:MAG: pyridoxamine 5'-phosphate oxidase family protein [Erysipelotrichaceae bacterium]|nr:pyridoxamine 5'-phosphate oxidase family protein [Erysipelotrichaceae bacterium]